MKEAGRTLPAPTDDLDRAEHDLRTDGICAITGVLDTAKLRRVRAELYAAADDDRARGREQRGFGLDASDELLVLLGYRTTGLGLVNGISPA